MLRDSKGKCVAFHIILFVILGKELIEYVGKLYWTHDVHVKT